MIVLGFGSNLGDREQNIINAINNLTEQFEITIKLASSLYETEPVGVKEQPSFLNAVAAIDTGLSPFDLLQACLAVEKSLGRIREKRWGPRIIDIDLLLYNERKIQTQQLVLPHPCMHERRFVLVPLLEILPNILIYENLTTSQLISRLEDQSEVRKYHTLLLKGGKVSLDCR